MRGLYTTDERTYHYMGGRGLATSRTTPAA